MSKPASAFVLKFIIFIAVWIKKLGICIWVWTWWIATCGRLESGLSKTKPTTYLSSNSSMYNIDVIAPILLPHKIYFLKPNLTFKYCITAFMSYFSLSPSVTNSPSDKPHPEKSKATTAMFLLIRSGTIG